MNILEITNVLTSKEMKRFGSFIRSPFFNTEARFIRVYEIIRSGGKDLTRETIAKQMFGDDTVQSDPRFRKLVSEFMKLFERFLAESEFSTDELNRKFMVLEKLQKMNLRKEFLKQADEIIDYIENETMKDEVYYRNMADIYAKKYSVEEINFKDYQKDLSFTVNEYTDKYFAAMKIFLFRRFHGLELSFQTDIKNSLSFYNEVLNYISENASELKENDPEIYLRFLEYRINQSGYDETIYNDYLEVLDKKSKQFKINESAFYSSLLSILSEFINRGLLKYDKKVVELAELAESKGIYRKSGITYIDLKVIIESAIGEGKFKWAIDFSERVRDFIRHENKNSVFNLISGKLYFFSGDFSMAKKMLSGISVTDYIHYIEGKLIDCRMEFELKNYLSVTDSINTVRKFLKSHQEIGKDFKTAYILFTEYLLKLVKLKEKNIKENISFETQQLEKDMTTNKGRVYAQQWLEEKLTELRRGK